MKTTAKEYIAKHAELRGLESLLEDAKQNRDGGVWTACEVSIKQLNDEYFANLNTVCVSYLIGDREYYEEVVKIGKAYFDGATKMTANRSYRAIEEIPAITKAMKEDMIADAHYY